MSPLALLPTKPEADERARYVARIVEAFDSATLAQRVKGELWYPWAHDIAAECPLGARYGAGIIAAFSPQKQWEENVKIARSAWRTGVPFGSFPDAKRKVQRMLNGEDPKDVLPLDSKTGDFFRCIADPEDDWTVVVDRHAHDLAAGVKFGELQRGLSTRRRYASIANAYREAADELSVLPSVVQAVTWTVQVDSLRYRRSARGDKL